MPDEQSLFLDYESVWTGLSAVVISSLRTGNVSVATAVQMREASASYEIWIKQMNRFFSLSFYRNSLNLPKVATTTAIHGAKVNGARAYDALNLAETIPI